MGKGGGGSTTSTVTQSNLPAYARPYYEALMDRGLTESERPYEAYKGDRLAGMSGATQTGLNMAGQFAQSGTGLLNQAAGINQNTAAAAQAQAGKTYTAGGINNAYSGPAQGNYQGSNIQSQQLGFGTGGIDRVNTGTFGQAEAQKYMSPYMSAVVEKAQADALQNAQEAQATRNLNAARTGSFGGSRAAVQNAIADKALQSNMSNIMVQGQQSAFENAQKQFNTEQSLGLQAQTQNQNTALNMGTNNQQAALDAAKANEQSRQYGYGATEQAYQTAAQLGLDAQKASEQFRQSGYELNSNNALKSLDLANQSAKNMSDIQGQMDSAMLDRVKAQLGIGNTLEDYKQQQLDQSYNDFVNQRDAERQNLQFLSSLLQGVPVSANQDVQSSTGQNQNNLQGMLGAAGGLQALYSLGSK